MTFSSYQSINYFLSKSKKPFSSFSSLRKIGYHKDSAIYVIELSNGYIISGGTKDFIYYNNNYDSINSDELEHNIIRELKSEKKDIELIICSKDDFSFKKIPKKDINQIISEPNNKDDTDKNKSDYLNFIILKTNSYMICKNDGLYIIDNLSSNIVQRRENKINNLGDEPFIGAIRINDQYSAFTSYKTNGNEKIVFFNCNSKKIIKEIEDDYEFIKSPNNMTLIKREEIKEKTKILLCACKKSKKNGILLIKMKIDDDFEISEKKFYKTDKFEVHCICPFLEIFSDNYFFDKKNEIIDTNFFLVGGYDEEKKIGKIKKYQIIQNEKIEFHEDINIGNIDDKNISDVNLGTINSITQSKRNGNILLTSSDGNVYQFIYSNI